MMIAPVTASGGIERCQARLTTAFRVLGRSVGYGAVVGAGVGTAVGLGFFVIGAVYGCPIGIVYGAILGLLNAPLLVGVALCRPTARAARIAAASASGIGGLATVYFTDGWTKPIGSLVVAVLWAGIGALVGPRAAFGKSRRRSRTEAA